MLDQFLEVTDEDQLRIMFGFMRLAAHAVGAQVGRDHAIAFPGDALGRPELHPIDEAVGEEAVKKDDRPALPHFAPGKRDPIG